ncbi:hypothetical protein OSH08_08065 [Kaistia geumhonensis]|uniref:MarR family transcriptional regulator n=1 Tax=Kaistia geumhonensis TaxID=410839 RepID=A0ABU0M4E8_9HYPH|nr:hypothetical protein [Kaistia geumhonensis]MCX5478956.1 hypothetical protein [Kaistia geumhonensis]MDQ0515825.1 hypothetical protein [Kaistia geumhonensis]
MTATLQTRARPPSDSLQPATPDDATIAAIEAHERFDAAYEHAARGILALFEGNRLLVTVMSDRVRVLLAVAVLCLDADPDEQGRRLTPARMIEAARDFGLGSPGRVKAMLAILRWGGYLAPAEGVSDRRERPLVPTEKLWNVVLARWRVLFEALTMIDPLGAKALAATGDHRFLQAVARGLARIFARGFRPLSRAPRLTSCIDRDAGFMILSALVIAGKDGAPAPPIAQLARRFGVSRAHVLSLLREAEANGLVRRTNSGSVEATELVLRDFAALYAAIMAMTAAAAAAALQEIG